MIVCPEDDAPINHCLSSPLASSELLTRGFIRSQHVLSLSFCTLRTIIRNFFLDNVKLVSTPSRRRYVNGRSLRDLESSLDSHGRSCSRRRFSSRWFSYDRILGTSRDLAESPRRKRLDSKTRGNTSSRTASSLALHCSLKRAEFASQTLRNARRRAGNRARLSRRSSRAGIHGVASQSAKSSLIVFRSRARYRESGETTAYPAIFVFFRSR